MSSVVVGRSRSRSSASAKSFDLVVPVEQPGPIEVAPDLCFVDPRQFQDKPDVVQFPQRPLRIVLHRLNFHRRQMFGAWDGNRAPARSRHRLEITKERVARRSADIHEIDASQRAERVKMIRVPRRDMERLVPERFEKHHELRLRFRLSDDVDVERATAETVRVEAERTDERVAKSGSIEKLGDRLKDAVEVHSRSTRFDEAYAIIQAK